jgi:glucosyl-3-phosphoglycerate synthase
MRTAAGWLRSNSFHHAEFPAGRIAARREERISVCLPARDEERTIGSIVAALMPLVERGTIDQVVVVDDSSDGTGEIASRLGAEVHRQSDLHPELGPVQGKGDAMWRSLSVLDGDIICFLDADSDNFSEHFACGLIGPLVEHSRLSFVKGFYRRPFRQAGVTLPEGGGRVTELMARPLLNLFYPDLAGVRQPLAGELAARRELLEELPFLTGYGVDIALLIDAYRAGGLDSIGQVDLDTRQNDHQQLTDLGPMAFAVLRAVASRLEREGRIGEVGPGSFLAGHGTGFSSIEIPHIERPPAAQGKLDQAAAGRRTGQSEYRASRSSGDGVDQAGSTP